MALNMVELGRELGLFLLEQLQGDGSFVVGVHQAAALVFDVRPPGRQGADCSIFVTLKAP
ncbi:hypothetical protein ACSAM2_08190 [Actinomyces oris]|uniref:hypothetical protein n=1 Tax=Actinomyces TaxID=1654 RepID=UPI0021003A1B|nr:hypothetical protein [Actinomyces oris]